MNIYPENYYLHGFNLLPQFGPKRLLRLANVFGSFYEAYTASEPKLLATGLDPHIISTFMVHRAQLDLAQEMTMLQQLGIGVTMYTDDDYPELLREIPAFPPLLYYRGTLPDSKAICLGVVGTRSISNYGRMIMTELIEPLVTYGITVVSGLAFGVDAAAHQIAVRERRPTIAVLGCGLDDKSLYPKDHGQLAAEIIATGGALLSEHPPGTPALKQHFVARNRIISGMSIGTLVVECGLKSGALITANHALDQNRLVYAVPGPIYARESMGPNNLLKMGAKPVTEAADILEDLHIEMNNGLQKDYPSLAPLEQQLMTHISYEPLTVDELMHRTTLDASQVTTTLTFLEMKGLIRNLGAQQYVLIKRIK